LASAAGVSNKLVNTPTFIGFFKMPTLSFYII